jgi:hypothetical protein
MARTLAPAVRRYFSATSRSRGDAYYWSGRFSASAVSATAYEGVVEGTQRYAVSLSLHGAELRVHCACPRFAQQSDPCKHVWTLVLAADAARAFAVPEHVSLTRGREYEAAERGQRVPAQRLTSSARRAVSERMARYWAERRAARRTVADEVPALDWPAPAARPRRTAATEWLDELAADAPEWQYFLNLARPVADDPLPQAIQRGELIYVLDVSAAAQVGSLHIELLTRTRRQSGHWAKPKAISISRAQVERLPQASDREILEAVGGAVQTNVYASARWSGYDVPVPSAFVLSPVLQRTLLPRMAETGRLLLRVSINEAASGLLPILWDAEPAELLVRVTDRAKRGYDVSGALVHRDHEHGLHQPLLMTSAVVLWPAAAPGEAVRLSPLSTGSAAVWLAAFMARGTVTVPARGRAALAEALLRARPPNVERPAALRVEEAEVTPLPVARVAPPGGGAPSGPAQRRAGGHARLRLRRRRDRRSRRPRCRLRRQPSARVAPRP